MLCLAVKDKKNFRKDLLDLSGGAQLVQPVSPSGQPDAQEITQTRRKTIVLHVLLCLKFWYYESHWFCYLEAPFLTVARNNSVRQKFCLDQPTILYHATQRCQQAKPESPKGY